MAIKLNMDDLTFRFTGSMVKSRYEHKKPIIGGVRSAMRGNSHRNPQGFYQWWAFCMNTKQKTLQIILFIILLIASWFLLALLLILILGNPNESIFSTFLLGGGAYFAVIYSWRLSKN